MADMLKQLFERHPVTVTNQLQQCL